MAWIFNNPIAGMWGPYFLVFFAAVFVVLFGFTCWHRGRVDESREMGEMPIPPEPDPYQIAYLRGGVGEVLRLAAVDLFHRGLLVEKKTGWFGAKRLELKKKAPPRLPPPVRDVAEFYRTPRKPGEMLESSFVESIKSRHCAAWESWVMKERLRHSEDARSSHRAFQAVMIAAFFSLGLYKLVAAVFAGRDNVGFLLFGLLAGSAILAIFGSLPRFTRRGRRFVENLQTAYSDLKTPQHDISWTTDRDQHPSPAYAVPVMAMGVFGIAALQGTPWDAMYHHYAQSAGTGSACGMGIDVGDAGGCGGGGGGGGGCGGCGGCGG